MTTPFNRNESWGFLATKHNGTIYLRQIETEQERQRYLNETQRDKLMSYWGYKFEDYMTTSSKKQHKSYDVIITSFIAAPTAIRDSSNGSGDPINPNIQFVTVARTRINSHSIVMGAEIDCCDHVSSKSCDHTYIIFSHRVIKSNPLIITLN